MPVNVGHIHMGTVAGRRGKEVENVKLEEPPKLTTIELHGDEFWPLSGRPYFDVVLVKSHLKPLYQLRVPANFISELPSRVIPTILVYKGKEWAMVYNGDKRFDSGWKKFAINNKLEIGDACVFELMDCSTEILKFRVQILRGSLPSKFVDNSNGESVDRAIMIE